MKKTRLINLLKQIRLDANLTQKELADHLNQSQSFVSKYESGEQRLDLIEIETICDTAGVPLMEFIKRYLEG